MELRHLRYFVVAAEERNVTRAATRLSVSQPAVSRQIRDLERELGVTLFDREPGGITLTEAGRTALQHAVTILSQANGLADAMQPFQDGDYVATLKVGFIPTALPGFLAQGMRSFRQTHPDVCVEIFEMLPQEQVDALAKKEIDVALMGHASREARRSYRVEPIREVPLALALPDNHPLSDRKELDLAELADESFLTLHEKHFPGRPELMKEAFDRAGISPRIAIRSEGLVSLLGHVGGGRSVALVPSDMEALPHPGVVFVKLERPRITLESSAAWLEEQEKPALLAFIEALKP